MKSYLCVENNYYDIENNFKQTFHHTPSKKVDVSSLIRNRIENEEQISDYDLSIIQYVKKLKFVTLSQISDLLGEPSEKVERKLSKLVRNKLLNSFLLSSIKYLSKDEIPSDVIYVYTLDYAGSEVLNHFVESDLQEWQCKDACLNPIGIAKILITNDFYIKVRKKVGDTLKSFVIEPQYPLDKYMLTANFELKIDSDEGQRIFLGEIINASYDRYKVIKSLEKVENFIGTEAYNKIYGKNATEPIILFICQNDDAVFDVSEIIENLFPKIKLYRLTTVERLSKDLGDPGVFLKYDRVQGGLKPTAIKMFKK